jgi:hypothetical protein
MSFCDTSNNLFKCYDVIDPSKQNCEPCSKDGCCPTGDPPLGCVSDPNNKMLYDMDCGGVRGTSCGHVGEYGSPVMIKDIPSKPAEQDPNQ